MSFKIKIFQSIRAKTIATFALLSLAILVSGVLGVTQVLHQAEVYDQLVENNAAITKAAQQALSASQLGSLYIQKSLSVTSSEQLEALGEYRGLFQGTVTTFDIFIRALTWGSESEAFKRALGGLTHAQWARRGWHERLVLREIPHEIRQLAGTADIYYSGFTKYASKTVRSLEKSLRAELEGNRVWAQRERTLAMGYIERARHYEDLVRLTLDKLIATTDQATQAMRVQIKESQAARIIYVGLIALGLFLLVIVASWVFLTRILVSPLENLMKEVRRIGTGKLDIKIPVKTKDEIGQLSASFNQMIDDLRTSTVSKNYVDNIIKSMVETLIVLNPDGTIQMVNQATLSLLVYEEEEIIGKRVDIVFAGEAIFKGLFQKLIVEGSVRNDEISYKTKDGKQIPILLSGAVMRDVDENMIGIVLVGNEITERKRLEEALREAQIRFRHLVNSSPAVIYSTKAEGDYQCTFVSENLSEVMGYQPQEMTRDPEFWTSHVHSEDVSRITAEFSRQLEEGGGTIEYRFLHKDGDYRWIHDTYRIEWDESGRPVEILGSWTDITERKRVEDLLAQQAEELARSNRELEQFASVASHDLQEPLRKIQAFGDRLKAKYGQVLDDQGDDYLERIRNAAARMQTLIGDLLTLSRVATQAQPFLPVDLAKVAQKVVSDLEVLILETGGRVEVGNLPTIDADPLQMRLLLQNLIGNGLKFHREGEPPVVKSHGKLLQGQDRRPAGDSRGNQYCQIIVEDNGIGFDEKYLDRIFSPFQRLHGRMKYEGTGMGLAICRKVVERHRGSISARSSSGRGATFVVTLPVKQPTRGNA